MTTNAETLQFTEDEIRAFGNALDRAEIEVSEGDPFDDVDEERYLANKRDVETAQAMWGRVRAALAPPRPVGTLADGRLHCPNGHAERFRYQEPVWTTRDVHGLNGDGVLIVDGLAEVQSDADEPDRAFFFCDTCDAEFDLPDGLEMDWS